LIAFSESPSDFTWLENASSRRRQALAGFRIKDMQMFAARRDVQHRG
jgi:hypothetical protein